MEKPQQPQTPPRPPITLGGLILSLIYFCFGVAALVLGSINYRTLHATWSESPWKELPPLELSVTIVLIVVSIIGLITFGACYTSKGVITVYIIICLLSLLFSWAIGIFAAIGATVYHKVDNVLGCDTKLTGILSMWKDIDIYLQYADSLHCSSSCPCYMHQSTIDEFKGNYFTYKLFPLWNVIPDSSGNEFTIAQCSDYVQQEILNRYIEKADTINTWFKPETFRKYWKRIEEKFDCTGWCKTNYIDPYTFEQKRMFKYVFRDINDGVVKYPGCLHRIVSWLPGMLGGFAGCLLVSAFCQTLTFIFALMLMCMGQPQHVGKDERIGIE